MEYKDTRIIIRITDEKKKAIQEHCKKKGITVADLLRQKIDDELAR